MALVEVGAQAKKAHIVCMCLLSMSVFVCHSLLLCLLSHCILVAFMEVTNRQHAACTHSLQNYVFFISDFSALSMNSAVARVDLVGT